MELTVTTVVVFISLIACTIKKTFNIKNQRYIPIQNLVIGLIAGVVSYFAKIDLNLFEAIVISVIAAFSSDGVCNLSLLKKSKNEDVG